MKYELIVEHNGDLDGAIEFASEIHREFGCNVSINAINDDGEFVAGTFGWTDAREAFGKTDKTDKTNKSG